SRVRERCGRCLSGDPRWRSRRHGSCVFAWPALPRVGTARVMVVLLPHSMRRKGAGCDSQSDEYGAAKPTRRRSHIVMATALSAFSFCPAPSLCRSPTLLSSPFIPVSALVYCDAVPRAD
ncbi:hypothetical protein TraAM80_10568, partial [Trypanosoma rangeli]